MKLMIYLIFVSFLLSALPFHAQATTLAELQQQNQVAINAWIDPNDELSVKEQGKLIIEISTVKWFSGGTRIAHIDVKDAIILQRDKLASNSSTRRNGISWVVQRWELTIYPQKSGDYVIPPIPVQISIAATPTEKVTGTLLTPRLKFSAKLPSPYLTEDSLWIAAPEVDVTQTWNNIEPTINELLPAEKIEDNSDINNIIEIEMGDAITRTISINAKDSSAMMLPNVYENKADNKIDQGQLYLSPSELNDKQGRGDYYAERIEQATWMVQEAGTIELPEITLLWWNTADKELQRIILPSQKFNVVHTPQTWLKAYGLLLMIGLFCFIILIIFIAKMVNVIRSKPTPNAIGLINASFKRNWPLANLYLYRRLFKFNSHLTLQAYDESLTSGSASQKQWHGQRTLWQQYYRKESKSLSPSLLVSLGRKIKKKTHGFSFGFSRALPELDKITQSSSTNNETIKKTS